MSEDKKYSELEVAVMIRERLVETMKKHEELAKNSAHDIDAGTEANNDEAECPDYLANSLSEGSESPEGGQAPAQEGSESFSKDSSEDSEESDEESKEEYDFKKSEAGMHSIQYKTLKKSKGNIEFRQSDEGGASKPMSNAQQATVKRDAKGNKGTTSFKAQNTHKKIARDRKNKSREASAAGKPDALGLKNRRSDKGTIADRQKEIGQDTISETNSRSKKRVRGDGHINKSDVKATGGMDTMDKPHISDKGAEEKKGIKRPLEKCGDMVEAKSSSKLKKYLDKKK